MTNDMTTGKPLKTILFFLIPMLIGGIFQQFYNITDTLIVGHVVGSRALAAVGASASTSFFLLSVVTGLTNAFAIVISQYFGAKDEKMVRKTTASAVYICVLSALALCLIGLFFSRPLMKLLQTPEDILDDAALYIQICMVFSAGQVVYNGAASILRAVGDSKTPLYFLILSTVLNVALDLLFVIVFDMAVRGVAVATVIAQILSAVLCVIYMIRRFPIFRLKRSDWKLDLPNLLEILKIGSSMSLQSILLSVGDMTINAVINSYGTNVIAAYTAGLRVQQFASLSSFNLAQAFAVYAGQNLGARKFSRIRHGMRQATFLCLGITLLSTVIVFLFGDNITRCFISSSDPYLEEIVIYSRGFLRTTSLFYPFLGLIWLYNNALRGMGDIVVPFLSSMIELTVKVGLSLLFSFWFGYLGVWWANPIAWALGLVPSLIRYYRRRWMALADRFAPIDPDIAE
ncbi:MATE family efflux transporter [Massilimaliae timonensis]|uniref:Probable multidrug resistance protein NorM n=1 Tax=Massiliimalia timonensis TaxID=1987501 RepID=A0A8J6PAZ7_9FIRM|nr:MATE family efflux transporter [Massiliimalia timonensis]MBC8610642.1 MATE family efflux transporter [Massiliimalia timonensis]